MSAKIAKFRKLLQRATEAIPVDYFLMPIAGQEEPIYRERVYCYELYHQLRLIWPSDYNFVLGGEVDKSGHPLFRDGPLNRLKPDFLVHTPGYADGNLIVIEVKAITAPSARIRSDISNLSHFISEGEYQLPIFFIFGETENGLEAIKARTREIAAGAEIDIHAIELWWHPRPGVPASVQSW